MTLPSPPERLRSPPDPWLVVAAWPPSSRSLCAAGCSAPAVASTQHRPSPRRTVAAPDARATVARAARRARPAAARSARSRVRSAWPTARSPTAPPSSTTTPGGGQPRPGAPRRPAAGRDGRRGRPGRVRRQQRLALRGLPGAAARRGGRDVRVADGGRPVGRHTAHVRRTSRATRSTSAAPTATAWLSEHGAAYGLCQVYRNEPWHYELRPDAVDRRVPGPVRRPHARPEDAAVTRPPRRPGATLAPSSWSTWSSSGGPCSGSSRSPGSAGERMVKLVPFVATGGAGASAPLDVVGEPAALHPLRPLPRPARALVAVVEQRRLWWPARAWPSR